jgi:ABC-type iron transport system FetAB permease component
MDIVFWICIKIMTTVSSLTGISYQHLNVILFVLLHPAITTLFIYKYLKYKKKYNILVKNRDHEYNRHNIKTIRS